MPYKFLKVFVWNEQNKKAMHLAKPQLKDTEIEIIGPVQFDFYYNNSNKFKVNKSDWLPLKMIKNKRVILYNGGPSVFFKNETEYIQYIDEAIDSGQIKDSIIILRIHPMDGTEKWKKVINNSKNIISSKVWGHDSNSQIIGKYQNIYDDDIKNLKMDLKFSDVHISICSTMVIDGSIFDKPQIGPAFSNRGLYASRKIRKLYKQFHFKEIINSGALKLSMSRNEFIEDIKNALDNPGKFKEHRKKLIKSLCHFEDGKSADRLLNGFQNLEHIIEKNKT